MSQAVAGFVSQLYVDVGGGVYTRIGEMKDVTIRVEADVIDVSSHSTTGWKDNINGLKQWSGTSSYLLIQGDAAQDQIYNMLIAFTAIHWRFQHKGDLSIAGDDRYAGDGIITSWELSGPNNDASAVAVDILGAGALTKAAIPA